MYTLTIPLGTQNAHKCGCSCEPGCSIYPFAHAECESPVDDGKFFEPEVIESEIDNIEVLCFRR